MNFLGVRNAHLTQHKFTLDHKKHMRAHQPYKLINSKCHRLNNNNLLKIYCGSVKAYAARINNVKESTAHTQTHYRASSNAKV